MSACVGSFVVLLNPNKGLSSEKKHSAPARFCSHQVWGIEAFFLTESSVESLAKNLSAADAKVNTQLMILVLVTSARAMLTFSCFLAAGSRWIELAVARKGRHRVRESQHHRHQGSFPCFWSHSVNECGFFIIPLLFQLFSSLILMSKVFLLQVSWHQKG